MNFNNGFVLFGFFLTPLTELYRLVLRIKTMTVRKALINATFGDEETFVIFLFFSN